MITNYLWIFFISMVPLIELRGAIPVSQALQMPVVPSYIICILGNMIPVPVIYLFARRFLEWGKDKKAIGGICRFFREKGTAAGAKLQSKAGKGIFIALLLFVGIPVPGTGAWTLMILPFNRCCQLMQAPGLTFSVPLFYFVRPFITLYYNILGVITAKTNLTSIYD